jgi:DNA mismatch repair protein MutS2
MPSRFSAGDAVQTRFGKGVVQEVRNGGRLVVDVQGRSMVLAETDISVRSPSGKKRSRGRATARQAALAAPVAHESPTAHVEIDLHGLTVDEALERADTSLNNALLANVSELRFIHGRSGGRIRAALHRRLGEIPTVRKFGLDPRNDGVTIVAL